MPRASVKTKVAGVKVTADQYRKIEQRAEQCKLSMSTWMRLVLMQAVTKPAKNGYISIKEPDGALT